MNNQLSNDAANYLEDFYITTFDTLNPENGYNLKEGGAFGKMTIATCKKISEANSGSNNFMYGKKHTEETCKKISDAVSGEKHRLYGKTGKDHPMYGKHHTEETRKKLSDLHTGRKHSEESKQNMRLAQAGKTVSPETRNKLSVAHTGKKMSDASKKKMSEQRTGDKHRMYGKEQSEETRNKISQSLMGHTPANRIADEIRHQIKEDIKSGKSVKDTMEKYNIGKTLYYVLRRECKLLE